MVAVDWRSNFFLGGLLLNQPATVIAVVLFYSPPRSPRPPFDVSQASQTHFFDACSSETHAR